MVFGGLGSKQPSRSSRALGFYTRKATKIDYLSLPRAGCRLLVCFGGSSWFQGVS